MLSWILGKKNDDPPQPDAQNSPPEEEIKPPPDPYALIKSEKWLLVFVQMVVVFLTTGSGSIGTGVILSRIANDKAFKVIRDLYLLMPVLQSFKGNVDACLAARLSTQANLGNLDKKSNLIVQVTSNLALAQVQCIIGAMIITLYSVALGSRLNRDWDYKHAVLQLLAALITNSITSFFLDLLTIGLILLSKRFKINPDNVVCPITATMADLTTLVFFCLVVDGAYFIHRRYWWTFLVVISLFVLGILPLAIMFALKLPETKTVLFRGWYVLLIALVFSCLGGLVLDTVVDYYRGYVLFQPVLNGTAGNFATLLCPRLSTMLFRTSSMGAFHEKVKMFVSPHKVWCYGTPQAKCVRMILAIGIPGQLIFVFLADYVYTNGSCLRAPFVFSYLLVSTLHMLTLIYVSHLVVHALWRFKIDPDNAAIPIVAAIGDFLGQSLLASAFAILIKSHQEYLHGKYGDEEHGYTTTELVNL